MKTSNKNDPKSLMTTIESGKKTPLVDNNTTPELSNLVEVTTSNKTDDIKPTETEPPKKATKAQKAKVIYEEMINDPMNNRELILAKIKKELALTKAGALTYFYKFQRESGVIIEKGPTKLDKAKEVYNRMILEGYERKDIMVAFTKEAELTPAGASTYFQNLKKAASK